MLSNITHSMNKISAYIFVSLFMVAFSFRDSSSQDFWSAISSPTTNTLNDCSFINSQTGWISGESGTIIRTTSGGKSWTVQNSGTSNNIEDMFFLNERLGWAIAFEINPDTNEFLGTEILTTTNGGNTWMNQMFPDTNMFLTCVYYIDSLTGFLGGIGAAIYKTTNGGNTWRNTDSDSTLFFQLPVFKIKFFNDNLGYACGGFRDIAGITWVTTNGGLNWKGAILAPEPFFDITILNDQKTVCSGGDLEYGSSVARTTNQGQDWYYDTLGVFGLAYGISSRTSSEIWMASGYAERFLYSLDTGVNWTPIATPGNVPIFDVEFTDSIYGFACGNNGTILKYDRSMSSVYNTQNDIANPAFTLEQNYPNPFNPVTVIRYNLNLRSHISLRVFDIGGKEVASLVDEVQNPGSYNLEFVSENLSSGIYYYTLKSGKSAITKKMIILK
jgi:photosystem II stability/assembly factor-like uncharacterized protein